MRPLLPYCAGAVLGGTAGAAVVVVVTTIIKESLAAISGAEPWLLLTLPVVGVALATVVLHVIGHGEPVQRLDPPDRADADPAPPAAPRPRRRWIRWTRRLPRIPAAWATFPADVARADLTGDVVASAGAEEQFPWRQAPLRAVAIVLTVGLGAPMGTEAPAAHLGVATGSWIGQTRPALRRMQRGAAIAGGRRRGFRSDGRGPRRHRVHARVGPPAPHPAQRAPGCRRPCRRTPRMGREHRLPTRSHPAHRPERATGRCRASDPDLPVRRRGVRSPDGRSGVGDPLGQGLAGRPLASPDDRGGRQAATSAVLFLVADPGAGFGPGGGAILWAESPARSSEPAMVLLLVAVLRAVATTTAVAAGGCGGVFVPFLAIGDLAARSFAPHLGISSDLAGASGAAAGIAGGYRLPWTAVVMVIGIGGPFAAVLTSLGSVLVASVVGVLTALALHRLRKGATG